jgi:hypothetical protein
MSLTAAQLMDLQAESDFIVVPEGLHILESTICLHSGKTWFFQGSTIRMQDPNLTAIVANGATDWRIIGRGTIMGPSGPPQGCASRSAALAAAAGLSGQLGDGLRIINGRRFLVDGLTVGGINGIAIKIDGIERPLLRGESGVLANVTLRGNWCGLNCQPIGSEYVLASNLIATGNRYAANVYAGSVRVNGGNLVDNVGGLYVGGGANHAHGGFINVNLNHNDSYNLWVDSVSFGENFSGCHIYGDSPTLGVVKLINSYGVAIRGGIVSAAIENCGGAKNMFESNYITDTSTPVTIGGSAPSNLLRRGNFTPSGMWSENNA